MSIRRINNTRVLSTNLAHAVTHATATDATYGAILTRDDSLGQSLNLSLLLYLLHLALRLLLLLLLKLIIQLMCVRRYLVVVAGREGVLAEPTEIRRLSLLAVSLSDHEGLLLLRGESLKGIALLLAWLLRHMHVLRVVLWLGRVLLLLLLHELGLGQVGRYCGCGHGWGIWEALTGRRREKTLRVLRRALLIYSIADLRLHLLGLGGGEPLVVLLLEHFLLLFRSHVLKRYFLRQSATRAWGSLDIVLSLRDVLSVH